MAGGIPLDKEKEIRELEEGEVYKYLGVAQRFGPNPRKTRQGVEKEYIARTREVWGAKLDMRGKVEAQNMWGAGVMRYSLGTIDWPRSAMKELDRTTRRIMRQNRAHQYGASVARLYLPRNEGGRGLINMEHMWEVETLTAAAYLHSNPDQQVRLAMRYREQLADTDPNGLVAHALGIGKRYHLTNLLPGEGAEGELLTLKKISNIVRASQKQGLREERAGKTIHGAFAIETSRPECDRAATHAWLRNGRFRAETEGLLVAAQDGVTHTAAYRHRILKEGCD